MLIDAELLWDPHWWPCAITALLKWSGEQVLSILPHLLPGWEERCSGHQKECGCDPATAWGGRDEYHTVTEGSSKIALNLFWSVTYTTRKGNTPQWSAQARILASTFSLLCQTEHICGRESGSAWNPEAENCITRHCVATEVVLASFLNTQEIITLCPRRFSQILIYSNIYMLVSISCNYKGHKTIFTKTVCYIRLGDILPTVYGVSLCTAFQSL